MVGVMAAVTLTPWRCPRRTSWTPATAALQHAVTAVPLPAGDTCVTPSPVVASSPPALSVVAACPSPSDVNEYVLRDNSPITLALAARTRVTDASTGRFGGRGR